MQHVILILSGKGGVGKSTVATQIALGLKHAGKKVCSVSVLQIRRDNMDNLGITCHISP